MNRIPTLLFLIFNLAFSNIYGQQNPIDESAAKGITTVNIPSPNTSSLLRFTDIPISLYTGLPDVNFPIYSIKLKEVELPIQLRHNGGGVRISECASWVGMGWALNFGGVISQNIRAQKDDDIGGRFNSPTVDKMLPSRCEANAVLQGEQDGEPDLFTYSVNGLSGSFVLDDLKGVFQIPEQKIKIEPIWTVFPPNSFLSTTISSWKITDLNGTEYYFETYESLTTRTVARGRAEYETIPSVGNVSWFLTKIKDRFGEEILFEYEAYNSLDYYFNTEIYKKHAHSYLPLGSGPGDFPLPTDGIEEIYTMQNVSNGKRIKKILFPDGSVEFKTGAGRCDLSGDKYLASVEVYNKGMERIKEVKFTYKYLIGNSFQPVENISCVGDAPFVESISSTTINQFKERRLFLTAIEEKGRDAMADGLKYVYEYENSIGLPNRFSKQQDWWGTYNGNNHTNLLQDMTVQNGKYTIHGREPVLSHALQGVLKRITFPTGGYRTFQYELNTITVDNPGGQTTVFHPQRVLVASGLSNDVNLGSLVINDISGSKTLQFQVERCVFGPNGTHAIGFYIKDQSGNTVVTGNQVVTFNSQTNNGPFSLTLNNGDYTIYSYSAAAFPCDYDITIFQWSENVPLPPSSSFVNFGGLRIKKVTNFYTENGEANSSNYVYTETINGVTKSTAVASQDLTLNAKQYITLLSGGRFQPSGPGIEPREGALSIVNVESNTNYPLGTNNNGYLGYRKVKEQKYNPTLGDLGYTSYEFRTGPNDSRFEYTLVLQGELGFTLGGSGNSIAPTISASWERGQLLKREDYKYISNNNYDLVYREENSYSVLGRDLLNSIKGMAIQYLFMSVIPSPECSPYFDYYGYTPYQYTTGRMQLNQTTVENKESNGSVVIVKDFEYNQNNHLPSMVKVSSSKGDKRITRYKYSIDYDLNYESNDEVAQGLQALKDKNLIGAVVEEQSQLLKGESDLTTLAAVLNTYKPGSGLLGKVFNWRRGPGVAAFQPFTVSAGVSTIPGGYYKTGSVNSYGIAGVVQEVQKNNDIKEIFIWGYNNHFPVAKIIGTDYQTVSSIIDQTLLNSGTEAQITQQLSALRNAFTSNQRVQVYTYTYKPLIGMTSETDPKGRTTYYEYDSFNRLHLIRDHNGNIIKWVCYNYSGQAENCPVN